MTKRRTLPGLLLLAISVVTSTAAEARSTLRLTDSWRFARGNPPGAEQPAFDDAAWELVSVPHDWAIAGPFDPDGDNETGKLPWRGEGWYRRPLELAAANRGKRVYLVFDGVMAFPSVYVNGSLAGRWDYGYNSFYFDVTELVRFGAENVLAVHVDTRRHKSRWYPGAGIYRKVEVVVVDPLHVDVWGTYITTPTVGDASSDVRILTTVVNASDADREVEVESVIRSPEGREMARQARTVTVPAAGRRDVEHWITLTRPRRWDVDDPALYAVETLLKSAGEVVDTYESRFGVRTAEFTADDGFHLNGRRVQLHGVNLHHDHGPLGAVLLPRAMERQIEVMQEMGVNSIRTSHNMPAPELLELCDRMGVLVIAEAFDKWDETADFLPGGNLEEFAERQLGNFLRRDRNHPSVVLWSVGNEVWDVLSNEDGTANARLHLMTNTVRKYDPSRPVTFVTTIEESLRWRQFQYFDVHSWNYRRQYATAHAVEPRKAALAAESGSTVSTRGYYELPLPKDKTDHHLGGARQVSSYDLLANQWTDLPDDTFHWLEEDRYAAGEYAWTGFDYLGEPVPYGWYALQQKWITPREAGRSSYFGIVDLVGIPKDRYYLYRSYWAPEKTTIHLLPHWNWEGSGHATIPVFVYTNGDSAELFLNGRSQGIRRKKPTSQKSIERYRLMWMEVPWEPGELRAVAFREGKEIGETVVRTAGEPAALKLTPDRTELSADGDDLAYVLVESFDDEGRPTPLADNRVQFDVTGPARIAGVGNGNPQSLEPFVAAYRKLFYGKAMLILRTEAEAAGEIRVRATSQGMSPATATLISRRSRDRSTEPP